MLHAAGLLILAAVSAHTALACAPSGAPASAESWKKFRAHYHAPNRRKLSALPSRPPVLPTAESGQPWGGPNAGRWRPEAVAANAASAALNDAWSAPEVKDVLVAIPVKFFDSGFHPYGDGQSNSRPSFEGWKEPRPPVVAVLTKFSSQPSRVTLRFDRALQGYAAIEIGFRRNGAFTSVTIPAKRDPRSGDLVGVWSEIAPELDWDRPAHTGVAFVRPSPGYGDWFPVTFRHPVKKIEELVASVPANLRKFSDGKPIVDAEGMAQKQGDAKTPFEKLLAHAFPQRYNPTPYVPANIHGEFGAGGTVTGVGRGWTWVAERDAPFKIMYTCFERRQPGAEASARDGGVASGGGWHAIGDNAETILNSVEKEPVVVASGFVSPGKRIGFTPPPGSGYSYGLSDVAIVRWLQPGEAFLTVKPADGPLDHHWYFFQQDREVCTEEWVHPCRPSGDDPDFRC